LTHNVDIDLTPKQKLDMPVNTSLYAIPIAWLTAIAPRGYAVAMFLKHSRSKNGPEVRNPRWFAAQAGSDQSLTPAVQERIKRAESAQLNGFENLAFFASSVVAGNAAGLDTSTLNSVAWAYIATRIIYNHVFINNDRYPPLLRTAIFMSGVAMNCALFVLAGMRWQSL
jgi:uncharacterized MAPEG superfamily protein